MGRRIRWLALVLLLAFALILGQLVNIQMRQATALNNASANARNHLQTIDNQRGVILAYDGTVLARSEKVKNRKPTQQEYYRTYATGSLYSALVGYSSPFYGTSGVEYVYNTYLGLHTQEAQSLGQLLNPPQPTTDNVTLNVVPSLQQLARAELASIPDANKDGSVVVEDVKTGAILAMYSSPSYTNNGVATPTKTKDQAAGQADFHTPDGEGYLAYPPMAYWDTFAPGSTFKVVTTAAVYNLKPTLAGFTYKVAGCTGKNAIPETNKQICNDATTPTAANPCGGTITQMLPSSCDPGYAMLGIHIGATALYQQATLFGYDAVPPIDENPVQKSRFPTVATLKPGARLGTPGVALSAFGQQTVASTALQGVMVAQGVADTGTVLAPHVMARVDAGTGRQIKAAAPEVYKQATSPAAAQQTNKLMQAVATSGTAAGVGFPSTMQAAVKTGTAQAGTGILRNIDWMIGFAPASNPRVAIAVVVPQQEVSSSGAEIAGPIVKGMLTAALKVVPPNSTSPVSVPPTAPPKVVPTDTGTTGPTTTLPGPGGAKAAATPPGGAAPAPAAVAPTTTAPAAATGHAVAGLTAARARRSVAARPPPGESALGRHRGGTRARSASSRPSRDAGATRPFVQRRQPGGADGAA